MEPRQPELANKIFYDENKKKYNGQRFLQKADNEMPSGITLTEVNYLNGKIHGNPAIIYPDGLEEDWQNGNFVKVNKLPYAQRRV
jgi:hypothetical protein